MKRSVCIVPPSMRQSISGIEKDDDDSLEEIEGFHERYGFDL